MIRRFSIDTVRGDGVVLSLLEADDELPSILLSIDDLDDSILPTVDLNLEEALKVHAALDALIRHAERACWRRHPSQPAGPQLRSVN